MLACHRFGLVFPAMFLFCTVERHNPSLCCIFQHHLATLGHAMGPIVPFAGHVRYFLFTRPRSESTLQPARPTSLLAITPKDSLRVPNPNLVVIWAFFVLRFYHGEAAESIVRIIQHGVIWHPNEATVILGGGMGNILSSKPP